MPEERVWFAHAGGAQHGPMARTQLSAMAAEGRLAPEDLVWESGTPEWRKAADVGGLFAPPPDLPLPPGPPPPPSPSPAGLPRFPRPPREPLLSRVARDLSAVEVREVLPLPRIAEPEVLGASSSWILLAFGLAPIALAFLVEEPGTRVRLLRLGAAAAWTVFLASAFRPPRPSARLAVSVFCAGGLAAALLLVFLPGVPPLSWLLSLTEASHAWPLRFLGWLLASGVLDESVKLLVVLLAARLVGGIGSASEGLFLGLVAGLGFGLVESAFAPGLSTAREGGLLAMVRSPSEGLEGLFAASFARAAAIPPLEAAWGAASGALAGLGAKRRAPWLVLPGVALAALLHGFYETFRAAEQGLGAILVAAATLLLLLAMRRAAEVADVADVVEGSAGG